MYSVLQGSRKANAFIFPKCFGTSVDLQRTYSGFPVRIGFDKNIEEELLGTRRKPTPVTKKLP
jgi:hypothetical protein